MTILAKLTRESSHNFIVSTVIPRLALQWQHNKEAAASADHQQVAGINKTTTTTTTSTRTSHTEENQKASCTLIRSFLHAYGLKTLSFSTAWI
jgi:hypothetical protein